MALLYHKKLNAGNQRSDITAVVLTIGEETTRRAIDSLKKQTLLPLEIVVIKDVTPFNKAINLGASKVKTEFFVQVDSDMILDANCFEELRKCMTEKVGIAIGTLKDSLMTVVTGVKIFRKKCFDKVQFKNSISPDTDFYTDIEKHGWSHIHVLNSKCIGNKGRNWHTLGNHKPLYTPLYTYSKYYVLGRRYRYRRDLEGIRWRFQELRRSKNSVSSVAEIALAHGIFSDAELDSFKPVSSDRDFDFLDGYLKSRGTSNIRKIDTIPCRNLNPKAIFNKLYKLGIHFRITNALPAFKHLMDLLSTCQDNNAVVAKIALCHGIFSESYCEETVEADYRKLKKLL